MTETSVCQKNVTHIETPGFLIVQLEATFLGSYRNKQSTVDLLLKTLERIDIQKYGITVTQIYSQE